jgi:uncharacterized membrane protein YeaQ/YmgE (transglycosylase-associated protein family)
MIIGVLGILIVAFFVSIAVFLFVPWLIGLTANAVSGSVTNRPLNLGCLGYIVVAVLGAILGHYLLGNFGPRIMDIYIVPAFVGSLIITIILSIALNSRRGRGRY